MKLTEELKQRIDAHFASISPQELYDSLINEFGFTEDDFEYDFSELYNVVGTEQYWAGCDNNDDKYLPHAA